ncbi:hypothetical protein P5673_026463 [Acropora cervicornis]|uniref:Uncharacterized protein n=1 Tax=Acropora cervicornis TaxID=6130 RepID=A0AAD9Q097_ACRCE|nr:hypothetical protein P5673_026463 [Acropora cervicornis]
MATDIETADESNSAELDVVGDSRLVQPTNAYGSPLAGASSRRNEIPEEATVSNVAVLNRVEFIQQVASQDKDKILLRLLSRPMRRKR